MKRFNVLASTLLLAVLAFAAMPAEAAKTHKVCWSHYTGWEPWAYADERGILKKWADKYGIQIKLDLINDYVESINLYTAGKYDACAMTNMDALTIPAVGGVDSSVLIIGDYSNGNDGIVLKHGTSVKDMKGQKIKLVELSVSHYLMSRALSMNGMTERDLTVVNTSDADIGTVFITDKDAAVVTWNPILMNVRNVKGATLVFDSGKIPGEILDLMVVKTAAPDSLKKALTGAWYETMAIMSAKDARAKEAIAFMAGKSGGTTAEFEAQLKTTAMFYSAKDAVAFARDKQVQATMDFVRGFSFDHGLFGQGAKNKDLVGISFPDGTVLGNKNNVKLRFDVTTMQAAADGKL
jgi:NitT/TauT family transport system substrate-binding protein